jgi:hypothetical protein
MQFALNRLQDEEPPLVMHFNERGILEFVRKMVVYILL